MGLAQCITCGHLGLMGAKMCQFWSCCHWIVRNRDSICREKSHASYRKVGSLQLPMTQQRRHKNRSFNALPAFVESDGSIIQEVWIFLCGSDTCYHAYNGVDGVRGECEEGRKMFPSATAPQGHLQSATALHSARCGKTESLNTA